LPELVRGLGNGPQFININKWNELSSPYKSIIRNASALANQWMLAKYDANNPAALKRLVTAGAQLRPFNQAVLEASYKATNEIYATRRPRMPISRKCMRAWWLSEATSTCGDRLPNMLLICFRSGHARAVSLLRPCAPVRASRPPSRRRRNTPQAAKQLSEWSFHWS
jgi:hypothetical protein